MSETTGQFIANPGPIIGAGTRGNILEQGARLPQMGTTIKGWFRPMTLAIVTTVIEGGMSSVVEREEITAGHLQPGDPEKLKIMAEGNRAFKNHDLWILPGLGIRTDDVLRIRGIDYKVMESTGWADAGFDYFTLLEGFSNAGR